VNRGVTIAALSACAAAGSIVALLLATAPGAGADDGTTSSTTATTAATTTVATTTAPATTSAPTTTVKPPVAAPKPIVAGVTIGRTLVGGLMVSEARALVKARFARPLTLVGGTGARIVVTPQQLGATPHVEEALQLAARVKRAGYAVPLKVDVSRPKVDRLVATLGTRFDREPVDATLKLRNLTPFATKDVPGRRLKPLVTTRDIVLALKTQQRDPLQLPFETIAPAVSSKTIGRAIVIRRGSNQLYLYRVGHTSKLVRQFHVATGRSQYPTPLGKFEIVNKQLDPWWYPPASDWAKDAQPIPPGPGNPLGTRWMGISSPNVGIHGTPDAASIGYSASHGCIRMLIPQVEWLFTQVDVGTPVFIVAA
jgi:lipoprotein-anchoring transpeptidase ErfK/SrfK